MATIWSENLAVRFILLVTLFGVNLPDAKAAQHVEAVCVINAGPPGSQVSGVIVLSQDCPGSHIHVTGTVNNLAPNSDHGFHIHERGDLRNTTNPCLSTAAHYNPHGKHHGAPYDEDRHNGDLGNIHADASGIATVDKTDRLIQLCGPLSVIGRAIVVHALRDDLGTDAGESLTTGNSGARVGCCVIGIVQPEVLHCDSDHSEKP